MLVIHHSGTTEAYREFTSLHRRASYRRLWGALTGRRHHLLDLAAIQPRGAVQGRHHAGVRLVPIDQIRGSEGRSQDFDADFRPLKLHNRERWVNIALARRADVTLPLVELIQIGDRYFVRDGHHRISVAKAHGQLEIEAEVIGWDLPVSTAAPSTTQPTSAQAPQPRWITSGLQVVGQLLVSLVARFVPEMAPLPRRV